MVHRLVLLGALLALACQSEPGGPLEPGDIPVPPVDPVEGRAAFTASCAPCHSSRDGFDLAFFSFPDSTIVRRAVVHVDTATARNIAAHVRALAEPGAARGARVFEPGGTMLSGDVEFAVGLFGADAWPADLSSDALLAIDPLEVQAAVPFPRWSVEFDNVDWMPDRPLPETILDYAGEGPRRALDRYYEMPTTERLVAAVGALRGADRSSTNPGAPCFRPEESPIDDPLGCFEVRRWTATLAAQHMLRLGLTGRVHPALHDAWWDVGDVARLSGRSGPIANRALNWAAWMYLGWAFEPARHASVYTGLGLVQIGLARHATFVALRSEVARPRGSGAIYADASSAARFAPAHWAYSATRFAFSHLIERHAAGERPLRTEGIEEARLQVQAAYEAAERKVTLEQSAELARLRDEVLAALS